MKLRELNFGDVMRVCCNLADDDWDQIVKFGGAQDLDALVARCYQFSKMGPAWAYVDDNDDAQVIGGAIFLRKGVISTWFLVKHTAWKDYGREITKMAIERREFMFAAGVHRTETLCLASRKLAQRWYKSIGLRHESTLQQYCVDGSDAVMYVATRGNS